jgi:pimeloyl-ACP methyl ester carboxylesterase
MTASVASNRAENRTTVRARNRSPLAMLALRKGIGVLSRVAPEGAALLAERMFLTPRRYLRPAAEQTLLAGARQLTFASSYGELAAWEWGPDEPVRFASSPVFDAPRVLLVHGWAGRGAQLGALVAPLVDLGFKVVTFDAPAHGDSPGEHSSLFHFADAVVSAVEAFGPFHAIVTHSMGGAATVWANRLAPLAARFVLIAPPVDLRDFTRVLSRTLGLPEDVRTRVHRRLGARFGVPIEEARVEKLASEMRGPMLVVHDDDDKDVPIACGEAVARAWPGAELVRTRGLGHTRILRDAETLGTVVRFVAQGRPRDAAASARGDM